MNIVKASPNHFPAAQNLMREAFHDEERFIRLFFQYFADNHLWVGLKGEKVVSMAFQLPASLQIAQQHVAATYLYACATEEEERGKGWMPALLERAWEESLRKGEAGIFLLPAQDSLYTYYARYGFRDFFYYDARGFHCSPVPAADPQHLPLVPIKACQYATLRREVLKSDYAVHYPLDHFRFIEEEEKDPKSGFYRIRGEEVLFHLRKDGNESLLVDELLGEYPLPQLAEQLCAIHATPRITIKSAGNSYRSALLRPTAPYQFLTGQQGYFCWGLE